MQKTLGDIALIVEGEVVGDKDLVIRGLSGLQEAQEGDLTFLAKTKYFSLTKATKASAIIVKCNVEIPGKSVIQVDNPSLAFSKILSLIKKEESFVPKGIDPKSIISLDADIGDNVAVGPGAVVEAKASIGKNSVIYGSSYIGYNATIGSDCIIYPNVTILERVSIGDRVIIHSGTVVGSDGFGYEQVNGLHCKIMQLGTVEIEDDVEIGANVTIDRARFDKTLIGKGTKIDNLVQIAHNVIIGENCIIIALVGISGTTKIGKNCILAGQSGVTGHLTIGEGTVVASKAGVTKSIPAFSRISGFPARAIEHTRKVDAASQRLPEYVKVIRDLKARVALLEKRLSE